MLFENWEYYYLYDTYHNSLVELYSGIVIVINSSNSNHSVFVYINYKKNTGFNNNLNILNIYLH